MKKGFRSILALFVLLGIMNCFILEPALAAHEETTCLMNDGCDDCFVCCSLSHQTIPPAVIPFEPLNTLSSYVDSSSTMLLESPTFSIFHPPLVF